MEAPLPNPLSVPTAVRGSQSARSLPAREKRQGDLLQRRLAYFRENVTTIKVPFALEDMEKDVGKLESICDVDLAQKSPQCFSAKFVDKNNKPILFYFGSRVAEPKKKHGKPVGLILK